MLVSADSITAGAVFTGDAENDILDAGLACAAERKALDYLARAEQSRLGLVRKLSAKGFQKAHIQKALDYLEQRSYLSDARFARSWLNMRSISHYEGRTRLSAELASRGIDRATANAALDEYFESHDEEALCRKALEKCRRQKKTDDKAAAYLTAHGFSYAHIRRCLQMDGDEPL